MKKNRLVQLAEDFDHLYTRYMLERGPLNMRDDWDVIMRELERQTPVLVAGDKKRVVEEKNNRASSRKYRTASR